MTTTRLIATLRLPLAGAAALLAWTGLHHPVHASPIHHAALVIEHSSGRLLSRCVSFLEDQISGLQLVQRSGIEYQTRPFGSLGEAVCQLDNEPQPVPTNCFGTTATWQYFHRTAAGWTPSQAGATDSKVSDGAMDGWHYAGGGWQPPPAMSFASVCSPPAPSPTAIITAPANHSSPAAATSSSAAATTSAPTPTAAPSLQALAPTATPTARSALAATGPTTRPPSPQAIAPWLFLVGATLLLVMLGIVTVLRHGP